MVGVNDLSGTEKVSGIREAIFSGKVFVTVGNGKFDSLISEIDRLVACGVISGQVLCQIGHGKYEPKNCKWYRFKDSLEEDEKWADLVVSHGGPGTIFELLRIGKKVIALPNRNRTDVNHQVEFLEGLFSEGKYFLYCSKVPLFEKILSGLNEFEFKKYLEPECYLADKVNEFLK